MSSISQVMIASPAKTTWSVGRSGAALKDVTILLTLMHGDVNKPSLGGNRVRSKNKQSDLWSHLWNARQKTAQFTWVQRRGQVPSDLTQDTWLKWYVYPMSASKMVINHHATIYAICGNCPALLKFSLTREKKRSPIFRQLNYNYSYR